jgi:N-acetylmuramoyl-L-alanine amidase
LIGPNETTAKRLAGLSLLFFALLSVAAAQQALQVAVEDQDGYTRAVVSLPPSVPFELEKDGALLLVRLTSRSSFRLKTETVKSRLIKGFSWAKSNNLTIIIIQARHERFRYDSFRVENKNQLVIDFYELTAPPAPSAEKEEAPQPAPVTEEKKEPPAPQDLTPVPVEGPPLTDKGVRTIVIDPGHGGLEYGAKGKFGTLEKDITLAISLRLKGLIEKNLAFHVELTRDRDMDVSLENRAAIANNHRAELFISVHANSSYRPNASGSETFFLSLNATDEESRRLAYQENNSADLDKPLASGDQDDIKMILWDMAQSAYLKQSQRLAEIIQDELNSLLGTRDRGIKQAPFKVLTGVACPAVLVESAFISNPQEERELAREAFQENVAQAIYRGLVRYIKLLS